MLPYISVSQAISLTVISVLFIYLQNAQLYHCIVW